MELFLKKSNNFGILIFRGIFEDNSIKTIYYKEIKTESLCEIETSLDYIENNLNYSFKSFTIDGRKGVIQLLERKYPNIPIQVCQYHQKATIRRYLTLNPKLECSLKLKELIKNLCSYNKEEFTKEFNDLENKYKDFLKEKTEITTESVDCTKIIKTTYKHKRIRSAIRSLKTNLPYLFTYREDKYKHLNIPNTTNICEGLFGSIKPKITIHRGLKINRKKQMFLNLLDINNKK